MRHKIVTVYVLIFLLLLIIFSYYFLYNIYGSVVKKEPEYLYADPSSEIRLEVIPINSLGFRALLRSSSASFDIIEGKDLIEIIYLNQADGILKIRSKGKTGVVGIKIKSEHSLLPDYVEIQILPLTA